MQKESPIVTVIGTCRVHRPLQEMEKEGRVRINNRRTSHYMHTSKEVIQYLRFLSGEAIVPDELAPYVTSGNLDSTEVARMSEPDITVIEISSNKEISMDDVYLQLNYLTGQFIKGRDELLTWWRALGQKARQGQPERTQSEEPPSYLTEIERQIYLKVRMKLQSPDALIDDLETILAFVQGRILFVNHADVLGRNGTPIVERQTWISAVQEAAISVGYPYFDPSPIIHEYGQVKAMLDEGKSASHYSDEFNVVLGKELMRVIEAQNMSQG